MRPDGTTSVMLNIGLQGSSGYQICRTSPIALASPQTLQKRAPRRRWTADTGTRAANDQIMKFIVE